MSWKNFSSNTKRNGSIYASKVFTENIVFHKKAELDSIDISIINYPKDNYDSSFITISNIMKCNDLSVDIIGVQNGRDTLGVVKFVKSISAPAGTFNILKAKDGCFNNVDVSSINYFNTVQSYNNDIIEVSSNSNIFNSHSTHHNTLTFNDVCVNNINETNPNAELNILSDISINYNLLCKDISINVLDCLNKNDFSYINIHDICVNGIIYANEISANNIKTHDLCVNIIQSDTSINFKNNVVCNHDAEAKDVYIDNITSDVSINGDVSINLSLTVNKLKLDGNIGKSVIDFSGNAHLLTSDFTRHIIDKQDICVNKITAAGPSQTPITEIGLVDITTTDPEIITYGIPSQVADVVVIDGDISYDSIIADWEKSGLNIIPFYDSVADFVAANHIYDQGQLVIVNENVNDPPKLFIQIRNDFWHRIDTDNGTIGYNKIILSGHIDSSINIFSPTKTITDIEDNIKIQDNSYQTIDDNDICVFFVKNYYDNSNHKFVVDIDTTTLLNTSIFTISFDDVSFQTKDFSTIEHINLYNDGEFSKWGFDVSGARNKEEGAVFDFSSILIRPPVNNGFDLSFHIDIKIIGIGATSSKRILEFKKLNELPVWNHMKFDVSNTDFRHKLIDISGGDQSWNDVNAVNHKGDLINDVVDDASCVFYVRYFNPSLYGNDVSYYFLDLSAIDPEGYDVSYRISNDYITQEGHEDWSWNWSSNDSSRIEIKIPGEGSNQNDFSFTILAHDNSIPDVSNLIPETYYSHDIDLSKRIIFFEKVNDQPTWNYMKFGPSNDNIESEPFLDASWNNDSALNIDDISIGLVSGLVDMDLSKHFFIYYDSCRNNIHSADDGQEADLSYYYLDLSATDFEGFDVSYDISCVKGDLSFAFVGDDTSRIVIDISSNAATLGEDTSLAIISLDDWRQGQRDGPFKRIANFTYITYDIITAFEISYNSINTQTTTHDSQSNIHEAEISNNIVGSTVDIIPIIDTVYNTINDLDISFSAEGTNNHLLNFTIDASSFFTWPGSSNQISEISFNLLLNRVFKYQINLSLSKLFVINNQEILPSDIYNKWSLVGGNYFYYDSVYDSYILLLTNLTLVECFIPGITRFDSWHFIAGSGGGGGGAAVHGSQGSNGAGGGGGASGFVIQQLNTLIPSQQNKIDVQVDTFSNFGSGGVGSNAGTGENGSNATLSRININNGSYDFFSYTGGGGGGDIDTGGVGGVISANDGTLVQGFSGSNGSSGNSGFASSVASGSAGGVGGDGSVDVTINSITITYTLGDGGEGGQGGVNLDDPKPDPSNLQGSAGNNGNHGSLQNVTGISNVDNQNITDLIIVKLKTR